jgi:hypothetical protein
MRCDRGNAQVANQQAGRLGICCGCTDMVCVSGRFAAHPRQTLRRRSSWSSAVGTAALRVARSCWWCREGSLRGGTTGMRRSRWRFALRGLTGRSAWEMRTQVVPGGPLRRRPPGGRRCAVGPRWRAASGAEGTLRAAAKRSAQIAVGRAPHWARGAPLWAQAFARDGHRGVEEPPCVHAAIRLYSSNSTRDPRGTWPVSSAPSLGREVSRRAALAQAANAPDGAAVRV